MRKGLLILFHASLLIIFLGYIITLFTSNVNEMYVNDGVGGMVYYATTFDPWGKPIVFVGYALFVISSWCLIGRISWRLIIFAILISTIYFFSRYCLREIPPLLQSPWLYFHVTIVMMAYALFFLLCLSVIPQVAKKMNVLEVVQWGVTLLGTGIILGSLWADESWGSYWSWDPKETWALITFCVYSLPLHIKKTMTRRHWFFHYYYVFAFCFVLMTYFGVNYLLGGQHSYM